MRTQGFSIVTIILLALNNFAFSQCISVFPYSEGFESAPSWTAAGTNSDWAWGTPAHPNINAAGGGVRSWCVGGLTGTFYNFSLQSTLSSPCFDFSSLTHPWISFKIFWETERQWDGMQLQYSTNGGATWIRLGAFGDPVDCNTDNWFNHNNISSLNSLAAGTRHGWTGRIGATAGPCTGGFGSTTWVTAKHCLTGLAGQTNVRFRFIMGSGTTCNSYDGIAIDDIYISNGTAHSPSFSFNCVGVGNFNFTPMASACPTVSSYTWNFGDPASGPANTSALMNPTHVFSGPGIYTVTLTTAGGACNPPGSFTQTLQVSDISNAVVTQSINCFGGFGSASVLATGQTITYTWLPSGGNSAVSNLIPAGSYSVFIQDGNGCQDVKTVSLAEPSAISLTVNSSNANCGVSNGSATVTVAGGSPGYTYSWSPTGGIAPVASGLGAGNYNVAVTDSKGCVINGTVIVNQPVSISADVTFTNATCFGNSNGMAAVTVTGGTGPYNYTWTPNPTFGQGTASVTGLSAQNYSALVVDANGCLTNTFVTITQPASITLLINATHITCTGFSNGSATIIANGGTPGYSFTWSPTGGNLNSASNLVAGNYTCFVVDSKGCAADITATITQNSTNPLTVSVTPSFTVCSGANSSIAANGGGGLGNYQYTWTPGNIVSQTIPINLTANTIFTVTIGDGCSFPNAQATTTVFVEKVDASTLLANAFKGCAPLCITFTNTYFQTNLNVTENVWSFNDGFTTPELEPTHCFDKPGTYTLSNSFKTANGCARSATLANSIEVFEKPIADYLPSSTKIFLYSPEVKFNNLSQGATSYFWDFMGMEQSNEKDPIYSFNQTGEYLITLIAFNGICSDTAYKVIECLPEFSFYVPNTFTPDGDNLNDRFLPIGEGWKEDSYQLLIFDRWGEKLFSTKQPDEGWNGMLKGIVVKNDTYVWRVILTDLFNKQHEFVGTVTVMK